VSDLAATVANLRRLLEPAASRPWSEFWPTFQVTPTGEHAIIAGNVAIARDVNTQNALLIVAAVNALPTLLDAVERGERAMALLAKGLDAEAECEVAVPEDPPCGTCWTCEVKAFLAALTAKPR